MDAKRKARFEGAKGVKSQWTSEGHGLSKDNSSLETWEKGEYNRVYSYK